VVSRRILPEDVIRDGSRHSTRHYSCSTERSPTLRAPQPLKQLLRQAHMDRDLDLRRTHLLLVHSSEGIFRIVILCIRDLSVSRASRASCHRDPEGLRMSDYTKSLRMPDDRWATKRSWIYLSSNLVLGFFILSPLLVFARDLMGPFLASNPQGCASLRSSPRSPRKPSVLWAAKGQLSGQILMIYKLAHLDSYKCVLSRLTPLHSNGRRIESQDLSAENVDST